MYLWGKPFGSVGNWPHNSDDYLYEVKRPAKKHTQINSVPFLEIGYTCGVTFLWRAVSLPCNRVIFKFYEIADCSNLSNIFRVVKILWYSRISIKWPSAFCRLETDM